MEELGRISYEGGGHHIGCRTCQIPEMGQGKVKFTVVNKNELTDLVTRWLLILR